MRHAWRRSSSIALALLAAGVLAFGCAEPPGERDDSAEDLIVAPDSSESEDALPSPTELPWDEPTDEPTAEAEPDRVKVETVDGVYYASQRAVTFLTNVMVETTYQPESLRDEEQAAFTSTLVCESVASGDWTWQDQIDDDVSVGAPPGMARTYVNHLRIHWCPEIGFDDLP